MKFIYDINCCFNMDIYRGDLLRMIMISQLKKRYFKIVPGLNDLKYYSKHDLTHTELKYINKSNKHHWYISGTKDAMYRVFTEGFFTKYDIAYDLNRSPRYADNLFETHRAKHFNKRDIVELWHVEDDESNHIDNKQRTRKNYICGRYRKPLRVISIGTYKEFITNVLDPDHSQFYKDMMKRYRFYQKREIEKKLIKSQRQMKVQDILLKHYRKLLNIKKGSSRYSDDIANAVEALKTIDIRFNNIGHKSKSKCINDENDYLNNLAKRPISLVTAKKIRARQKSLKKYWESW